MSATVAPMRWAALVLVTACSSEQTPIDASVGGQLDPSFGIGGIVAVSGGTATDVTLAGSDIIVYGANGTDLIVARFSTAGVLEGDVVDLGVADPLGTPDGGMATTADGLLVLPAFDRVVRTTPQGVLDASFGSGGIVMPPDGETWHTAVTSLLNDDIIVCGTLDNGSPQPLVRRLDRSGAIDPTFGSGGLFAGDAGVGTVFDCDQSADGKIAIVGRQSTSAFVIRTTANGSADPTFGSGGVEILDGVTDARAVYVGAVDDIYIGGAVDGDFGIAQLSSAGDVAAKVPTPIGATSSVAVAITGIYGYPIVAAGTVTSPFDQSTVSSAVVRYKGVGLGIDPSFGSGGVAQLGEGTRVFALTVAPDGKIVVAGDTTVGDARGLFVARLLP
jgi:uncharacterized delta-60 repeat protein